MTNVVRKQLSRLGLTSFDVVSGTGDGGGENEGAAGIHHAFEEEQPSYVRRRCLNHLAWRVAKQALKEMDEHVVEAMCTYINSAQSTTWWRRQCLAVHSREDGGLALFSEGSREFCEVFSHMPCTIDEDRPESVMNFPAVSSRKGASPRAVCRR